MRFACFDNIRCVALALVIACHFLQCKGGDGGLGVLCGGVGNCLFFLLSGWLLGIGWRHNGEGKLGAKWLLRRAMRLYVPMLLT